MNTVMWLIMRNTMVWLIMNTVVWLIMNTVMWLIMRNTMVWLIMRRARKWDDARIFKAIFTTQTEGSFTQRELTSAP